MANVLVINAASFETRVALIEEGTITEYYVERIREKGIVGNIYKGRVVRVLPGMQAAFVDLGTDKAGFLYVNDVYYDPAFSEEQFELTEGEWGEEGELPAEAHRHLEAGYQALEQGAGPEESAESDPGDDEASEEDGVEDEDILVMEPESSPDEPAADVEAIGPAVPEAEATEPAVPEAAVPEAAAEAAGSAANGTDAAPAVAAPAPPSATEDVPVAEESLPAPSADLAAVEASDLGYAPDDAYLAGEAAPEAGADADALVADEATEGEDEDELSADADGDADDDSDDDEEGEDSSTDDGGESAEDGAPRGRRRRGRRRRGKVQVRTERPVEARREKRRPAPAKRAQIQDLLKEGQEIVVQVAKAPIGSKGARITTHISLPGRDLVFMPTVDHVGISRRIASDKERRRLRQLIEDNRPPGTGFIVRTVADGVDRDKLVADARFLMNLWADINKRKERVSAPALLHPDLDLILRATRDLFSEDVDKLIIDDRRAYDRVMRFIETHMPALKDKVELYDGREPIFDAYGIEDEIRRAQQRKVWLRSGGYLIIDQAEALTAIDVNSGRYIGKKDLEETITKINTEAADEVVYQLRLRNIGGIIILDFIDMEKSSNREKVFRALDEALRRDKAKTNILKISDLGLVEMTRKRVRESITRMQNEPCPYCDGRGMVRTTTTVAYEVLRDVMREAPHRREDTLFVNCNPEVAALLTTVERESLRYTMDRTAKKLVIKAQDVYHREQYDLYGKNTGTGAAVVGSSAPQAQLPAAAASADAGVAPASGEAAGPARTGRRRRRRRGRGRRDGQPGTDNGGEGEGATGADSDGE